MDYKIEDAVLLYVLRKIGYLPPIGRRDKYGRWYPDDDERQPCCTVYPTRRHPNNLIRHCCTLIHVTALLDVDYARAAREQREPHWRIVEKILNEPFVERAKLPRNARPRLHDYARALMEQAYSCANILTDNEITVFRRWLRAYEPTVDTIDWDAARAIIALQL